MSKTASSSSATAPRFPLGFTCATPGALLAMNEAGQGAEEFLLRHQQGDWSEMSEGDRRENEFSVDMQLRILSAYRTRKGEKLWVITEADRSATTILLPSEY